MTSERQDHIDELTRQARPRIALKSLQQGSYYSDHKKHALGGKDVTPERVP